MRKTARGFTLVELLVVIAIIAVLAAIVVLIINPLELMKRSRDAARFTDLANLQQAINVAAQEATSSGDAILCYDASNPGTPLTLPCPGRSNGSDGRNSNGSGWIKVNLSAQKSVSVPTLPVDPINDATAHYTYCSDGSAWEIDSILESDQQAIANDRDGNDGGNEPDKYEVGSDLTLIAPSGGSCTYSP
ncbi:MAG: prepilin-type N-terminal cleavage/methylation domain-containing protein [bacterium]|nr:prepilin-type N-terminal cleavage/methylation domain-containing protein [bacterium]